MKTSRYRGAMRAGLVTGSAFASMVGCYSGVDHTDPSEPRVFRELDDFSYFDRTVVAEIDGRGAFTQDVVSAAFSVSAIRPSISTDEFTLISDESSQDSGQRRNRHIVLQQTIGGVPVADGYLSAILDEDTNVPAMIASRYHVFDGVTVDPVPELSYDDATAIARDERALRGAVRVSELEIRVVDAVFELGYKLFFDDFDDYVFVIASGPRQAQSVVVEASMSASHGRVRGRVTPFGVAPGGGGTRTEPMRSLDVVAGGQTARTDGEGKFTIESDEPVSATLGGPSVRVRNAAGENLGVTQPAGESIELLFEEGAPEQHQLRIAQINTYYYIEATRSFMVERGFPGPTLDDSPIADVNRSDATCNAKYLPPSNSFQFFVAGGGCTNSAEASIIAHEYGHFVDAHFGQITNSALSEGWGDVLSCLMYRDPILGGGLVPGGIRSCDNDAQYPAGGLGQVHAVGQSFAGFVWDLRERVGHDVTQQLVLPALRTNAVDIPAAVIAVVTADDDDGNPKNGTPHLADIQAAADAHGLGAFVTAATR